MNRIDSTGMDSFFTGDITDEPEANGDDPKLSSSPGSAETSTNAVIRLILRSLAIKEAAKTATEKGASNLTLQLGKNAKGDLINHSDALGFVGKTSQQLQKMVPELKGAASKLLQNADPKSTKVGQWHQHQ